MKKFAIFLTFGLFVIHYSLFADLQGQTKLDSLLKELPKAKNDTNKVNLFQQLSFEYSSINPDKGIDYGKKGLELAKELNWKKGIANNYSSLAVNYMRKGNYDNSLKYFQKSLKINEELGNKRGIASNLGNIGLVYSDLSDYDNALKYYQKALKMFEELGNKGSIAASLANIGIVCLNLSDYDKALKYFQKALKLNEELGNKLNIAINLGNIGVVYQSLFDFDKALKYYQKALKMDEELGNKHSIAINLGNIGAVYFQLTQDSVISKIEGKSYELNLNKAYNLERALKFSNKAAEIAEEISAMGRLLDIYDNLQLAYKEKGDYKKAYEYLLKQKSTNDSVFSAEKTKEINQMTDKYEREQKEKEALIAAAKAAEELRYRNTLQYAGIVLIIIILVTTMFMFRKSNIRPGLIEASVFFTFLLFYEFITVLIEPWADGITNQEPLFKLGINLAVALLFIPLSRIEFKLRGRFAAQVK